MSEEGKGPLSRWSERKAKARREEATLETVAEAPAALPTESGPTELGPAESEEEAELDEVAVELPDIDSLDKDSDYSVFMGKGVPEHLKRLALRKLWRSDPILAGVDGLVDYGEDFTTSELMGDAVKTIYRVGKGLVDEAEELPKEEEMAEEEPAEEEAEIAQSATDDPDDNDDDEPETEG